MIVCSAYVHSSMNVFVLFKKVSKEKRAKATLEIHNKMAKLPWVHGRGSDTFYPRKACNSSKGRRMVNAWTKEALEHL